MHIFCIDLYGYNVEQSLTGIAVFSKYPYCDYVASKEANVVKEAYQDMISLLGAPEILLHDGGGEFSLIKASKKNISVSYHPQQNGIIERWHKELGKMCRIYNTTPQHAVKYLRTPHQRLLFFSELKLRYLDKTINVIDYKVREFKPNDLVWRAIPLRKRAKHEDGFTGPHRIISRLGEFTYRINSATTTKRKMKVNGYVLKRLVIPDTTTWKITPSILTEKMEELGIP